MNAAQRVEHGRPDEALVAELVAEAGAGESKEFADARVSASRQAASRVEEGRQRVGCLK